MAKIIVGCKIPNGLQMCLYGKDAEASNLSAAVILKGAHHAKIAGGAGITEVEKDFWDAWYAQNKNHPAVKAGFIFAFDNEKSVESKAREMRGEKTGFEGMNPNKPMEGIKPDESMASTLQKVNI
jgi:hypothetical protein